GGGMAEVFLGSTVGAEGFSRKVAIKRVLPGYSDNPQFSNMFIAEARISSRLVHPNIVSVLDFDRDLENRLFLVMELVDGKDLDALLQTGALPPSVVIHIIAEMLRGLGYAHDLPGGADGMRGVVHRDVSPHNVLLSWEGAAKDSDFGIAKAREASAATASVFIKGKPAYMSPEQANGEPLDGRSDLFAVGIMLWEMLVGRRLFTGGDTRATLAQVLFAQIPKPRGQRADVPKDLERVCMKLLERAPNDRYRSAEDAIADLMKCSSAPRAGRDELVALLAQRFPNEAPVRHSQRNRAVREVSRNDASGPVAMPMPAPPATPAPMGNAGAPTIRGRALEHPGMPAPAPIPLAHAVTHTAVPATSNSMVELSPASGRKPWLFPVIGLVAAAAVVSVIVVARSDRKSGKGTEPVGANAIVNIDASLAAAPPIDAAPVVAQHTLPVDAAPPPVDAAPPAKPVDAATATSSTAGTKPPPPKVKTGKIFVMSDPPGAAVKINGRSVGVTPNTFTVAVGKATVTLTNAGTVLQAKVTVREGQTAEVERSFTGQ
ncbi:MAG TPA: serine/threonine-protein kinase, partial [Kofleriaceae bacterium]|nr:serine/threonine-protein kinase [Kofleriaceae bacterium]